MMGLLIFTLTLNAVLLGLVVWIFRPAFSFLRRRAKGLSKETQRVLERLHHEQEESSAHRSTGRHSTNKAG